MNRVVLTQENGVTRKYVPAIGKNVYSLNGVYLIYELATPTTEQVTPVSLGSGLSFNDGTNQLESIQTMYFQEGRFK